MQKRQFLSLILLVSTVLIGIFSFADVSAQKKILVVVGYTDVTGFHLCDKHDNELSAQITAQLNKKLESMGLFDTNNVGVYESMDHSSQVTILNTNITCPGEKTDDLAVRCHICREQREHIMQIEDYLQSGAIENFDEFIYYGHAREGHGMGLGPFIEQFILWPGKMFPGTEDGEFPDMRAKGRLKKMVFASCASKDHYGPLANSFHLQFVGTDEHESWNADLYLVIDQLRIAIQGSDSK